MRYEDWDVLLFPSNQDTKVPMKEFKVACHVVPDGEFSHSHGSYGLPVMTCFIPGLQAGASFHISIHSWQTPEVSQFTRRYSKHVELVKYEARILVDGRTVASTSFERIGEWPHMINNTFALTKTGELEPLRFPSFRRELLYQNHWNPGDDLGRIKIIISEGFPRDSLSTPVERVKNIVAFSFQHAPIEILESNCIAWPNPHMWRGAPLTTSMPVPSYHPEGGSEAHSHSPRRATLKMRTSGSQGGQVLLPPGVTPTLSSNKNSHYQYQDPASSGSSCPDPFTDAAAYREWLNSFGIGAAQPQTHQQLDTSSLWPALGRASHKYSSTDTSMADYISSTNGQNMSMHLSGPSLNDANDPNMPMHLSGPSLDDDFNPHLMQAPSNTPATAAGDDPERCSGMGQGFDMSGSVIPDDLATSLTHSLLNQPHPLPIPPHRIPLPASEVKSRKENRHPIPGASNASSVAPSPAVEPLETRKFSQSAFGIIGGGVSLSNSRVGSDSPSSGFAFSANVSRANSGGEFGVNFTNMSNMSNVGSPVEMTAPAMSIGCDRAMKRSRTFTAAPIIAVDEEDVEEEELNGPSHQPRLSPYCSHEID